MHVLPAGFVSIDTSRVVTPVSRTSRVPGKKSFFSFGRVWPPLSFCTLFLNVSDHDWADPGRRGCSSLNTLGFSPFHGHLLMPRQFSELPFALATLCLMPLTHGIWKPSRVAIDPLLHPVCLDDRSFREVLILCCVTIRTPLRVRVPFARVGWSYPVPGLRVSPEKNLCFLSDGCGHR